MSMQKQPRQKPAFWYVEITDTFGGEANYSWIRRYKVKASTARGAALKVNREYGPYRLNLVMRGETTRHDFAGACICMFTEMWDAQRHNLTNSVTEI